MFALFTFRRFCFASRQGVPPSPMVELIRANELMEILKHFYFCHG